jgi:protease-4
MGADRIFAEPGTITGSIGVVGGKLAVKGLFEKVGVTTSVVSRGQNSGAFSLLEEFSESEREAMTRLLHDVYDQFTRKAAQGRKMDLDALKALAGGRIYTGSQAQKVGLVDELGSLEQAVAHAQSMAGMKPDEPFERMNLPAPTSPFEALFGPLDPEAGVQSRRPAGLDALEALAPQIVEKVKGLELVNVLAREMRLTLLPFRLTVK